jgi:hypothetical protein
MRQKKTQLHPQYDIQNDSISFWLASYDGEKRFVGEPVVMSETKGEYRAEPTFRMSPEEAKALFETLWAQGYRSIHDRGGTDRLDAARQEHIADLRKAAKLDRGA